MGKPYETIDYGLQVSRDFLLDLLSRKLRATINEKLYLSAYPVVVTESGYKLGFLHVMANEFEEGSPIPDGHEVHHEDCNIRNCRAENLKRRTILDHRKLHVLAQNEARQKRLNVDNFYRPHAKAALRPVGQELFDEIASRVPEEPGWLSLLLKTLPSKKQEDVFLNMALEWNFERFSNLAWPLNSKNRIPPKNRSKSFLDQNVKKSRVRPIKRSCSPAQATFVYLLRLHRLEKHVFDYEAALADLNAHRPTGVPEIRQATFDRMKNQHQVHEALKNLRKYERLPPAVSRWEPVKMKIKKICALPTGPSLGEIWHQWIAQQTPPKKLMNPLWPPVAPEASAKVPPAAPTARGAVGPRPTRGRPSPR